MKIRLTLTIAALLLISMLLVNLVLMLLWQRNAVQREAKHDLALLTHLQQRIQQTGATFFPCAVFDIEAKDCQLAILFQGKGENSNLPPLMVSALKQSISGSPISHSSFSLAGILKGTPPLLASAQPLVQREKIIGAVGIIRPLNSVLQELWQAEKMVLIYIVFNLLVLGTISFFRINSLIIRPIERLVELAGQYDNREMTWFASDDSGSEFQRLSNSLDKMMVRIESNRKILRKTVTELEQANQRLQEQQKEMIQTERLAATGRLAAGLAHEIGNPLAVVQGYIDLLMRGCQEQEQRDFLQRSDKELQRVNQLIRQLLDCARISKGKPKLVSLHEILNSVAEMVQVQKIFQQIRIITNLEAKQDKIYADPDQIRQVLLNCLLNSADAIHSAGQPTGIIMLSTVLLKPNLFCVRIKDNGTGIAQEDLLAVFDPFYTTKETGQGTGLGLSVSRSIVESAGGSIKIESRIGQGSIVTICLPMSRKGENDDNN